MNRKFFSRASLFCLIIGLFSLFVVLWLWRFFPFQQDIDGTTDAVLRAATIPIHSPLSGRIKKVCVKDYQKVEAGQTLFILDSSLQESEAAAIEKHIALLDKQLEILPPEDNLKREEKQLERSFLSESLNHLRLQQQESVIKTLVSGQLYEVSGYEGEYVNQGKQLTVLSGQKLWVIAHYKETQLDIFDIGRKVSIQVESFPKVRFLGTITAIAPGTDEALLSSVFDQNSNYFSARLKRIVVRIDFDKVPEKLAPIFAKLRSGMSATIMLHRDKAQLKEVEEIAPPTRSAVL